MATNSCRRPSNVDTALWPAAEALGFARCAEGFECQFEDHPDLERVFQRFEASIETMLRQHVGLMPVPWRDALRRLLPSLFDIEWCLVGSAALACHGVQVAPRDLDLLVGADDVASVAERLAPALVEPGVRIIERFIAQQRAGTRRGGGRSRRGRTGAQRRTVTVVGWN